MNNVDDRIESENEVIVKSHIAYRMSKVKLSEYTMIIKVYYKQVNLNQLVKQWV